MFSGFDKYNLKNKRNRMILSNEKKDCGISLIFQNFVGEISKDFNLTEEQKEKMSKVVIEDTEKFYKKNKK